ncbi:MAG: Mrp/NBP35 family ATP-binding protein [Planctomycetota bacterium]
MDAVNQIQEILNAYPDPETGRPMGKMGQVGEVTVDGSEAKATLSLTSHSMPIAAEVQETLASRVQAALPGTTIEFAIQPHERPPARLGTSGLKVKSVLLVGSGKGGVGKSTVAASIALSLQRSGCKVGLMDADVYGPSIPQLLGMEGRPAVSPEKKIIPMTVGDMPVMSMGFLVERDQAVVFRGPMLHGSIMQFLNDTIWGELDYLVIDMPPGTGDIALTLSQTIPLAGAVVVCTPQEVALLDAVKAISMFRKVNIPLAGMVENMSGFLCPDNGKTYDIFGRGGARDKAEELGVPFLGGLPIDMTLREAGDAGELAKVIHEDARARQPLEQITRSLVRHLAEKAAANPPKPSLPTL